MEHITVAVPQPELGPMDDNELVAYVKAWNMEPKGYPKSHKLYYFDREKGWTYLTKEGHAVEPCPVMLENEEKRCLLWAKGAVADLLEESSDADVDDIPPSTRQLYLAHDEALSAAVWCARHGYSGGPGSPLPDLLSTRANDYIYANQYRFQDMVEREHTKRMALGGD